MDGAVQTLALPSQLDLRAAAPLRDQILAARGSTVELDGSAVTKAGALCLQVLLSAASTWRSEGHELRITKPSTDLADALRIMGGADDLLPEPLA